MWKIDCMQEMGQEGAGKLACKSYSSENYLTEVRNNGCLDQNLISGGGEIMRIFFTDC